MTRISSKERWFEHRLESDARPKVMYEYYVTGRGDFPYDMLRHDNCWPATGPDAARMFLWARVTSNRSIKMRSYHPPTVDRWSSFVWSVGTENLESGS